MLAACIAGTVLYVSSSASEAAQIQLDQTCGADAGLSLPVYGDDTIRFLTDLAGRIPHTVTPIVTMAVPVVFRIPGDESVARRMVFVHRHGQSTAVTPALRHDRDGLALPAAGLHIFGLATIRDRASSLAETVSKTVAPVRLAGVLSASAEQELVDKSSTFIGSDMSIAVHGPAVVPSGLVDSAPVVIRMD